jgi:hypothetical protein
MKDRTRATTGRDNVLVILLNESRPTVWDQVCHHIARKGSIGNAEVRQIMRTDNTLAATRVLRGFVDRGLLVIANPDASKKNRRYARPEQEPIGSLFADPGGKDEE